MDTAQSLGSSTTDDDVVDRSEQRRRKKEAILQTAAHAFCTQGFHQTSLNDIAEKLNVTKPSLYYYVKNKDDILFECHRKAFEMLRKPLQAAEDSTLNARDRLRIFMTGYAETICDDFGRCLILCSDQVLGDDLREELWSYRRRLNRAVHQLIQDGIDDGSIAPCDPKYATFAIFGAFNWICQWYEADHGLTPQQVADRYLTMFESGLLPRPA